ncbi:MAG TPA: hypothetical protein VGN20_14675 [Mucilaginibacter sp.]
MKFKNLLELFLGNKRTLLLKKIKKAGFPAKNIYVSIEDFFDGNEDVGSIGANIYPDPPSLQKFYSTLTEIKNTSKTQNLLIRIADIEDSEWFYSDTIYISGDYSLAEIKKMFKPLKPDEVYEGMMYDQPSNIPQISSGSKAYSVWWD